ncbi:MAG: F0F1 ATP synthase subunit gamma [Gammaproteobacteria bacterium]|nr:F0F1 ATP synthase subunit gamma [Gammaproteobacteria bacterium]
MSRRHEINLHRSRLSEIRNIMNSMKILAVMETHKLEPVIEAQATMNTIMKNMAADFLTFNPQFISRAEPANSIIILVGSERGFCGDFNQQLLNQLEQSFDNTSNNNTIIAVGSKLHPLLEKHDHNIVYIEGADASEEIISVVTELAETLANYPQPTSLYVMHHHNQQHQLVSERLLPPFRDITAEKLLYTSPPLINLSNSDFFIELTDHYLFNSLHRILYGSLMIENQRRIQHLENATRHLDTKTDELARKINALRQEEIIEEIEVILLNVSSN